MSDTENTVYDALTVDQIVKVVEQSQLTHPIPFELTKRLRSNKLQLIQRLLGAGTHWRTALLGAVHERRAAAGARQRAKHVQAAERMRERRRKARERERQEQLLGPDLSRFLELPNDTVVRELYGAFHKATTNDALLAKVCAVCARAVNVQVAGLTTHRLEDIPNVHRLCPATLHAAQLLTKGYLLERAGCLEIEKDVWDVDVCAACLTELQKENITTPPRYSLANNLWVGDVPWELNNLTFAEHLLIPRVYPRVFVVKIFPKSTARHGLDPEQLQNALRGNVTSFELNGNAIADMISGNLMPHPPAILASVLSVTFVGRRTKPTPAALRLFRVRRHAVDAALRWLKVNNPKYYGDIEIDASRLSMLPEDDVPDAVRVNMHREEDDSVLNQESDGYIPEYNDEDESAGNAPPLGSDGPEQEADDPDVVPLQHLAAIDNDMSNVSASELMAWGLSNLGGSDDERGYAVRYGQPVNTFGRPPTGAPPADPDRPNYWERAFPVLYPYGVGGIEIDQPTQLSFIEHIRWALQYYDKRFRLHPSFLFIAFAILQRRQVLGSTRIQMKRRDFAAIARTLRTLTPADLRLAAEEEDAGRPHSNGAIKVLKRYIHATASRVAGSDSARFQLRSQIWSTSVYLNPPTLWITINPDDLHDPIAQVFAGEEIDMDNFVRTAGPDKKKRASNIARDPYAAAQFFNFMVTLILEKLFGIRSTPSRVYSSGGVLGEVQAYFGTVECQGRGTLHLHMLVWLKNAPSPDQLQVLLRTPEFKARVIAYLRQNVRAYVPQLSTPADLKALEPDPEVAYSRLPNPSTSAEGFSAILSNLEANVVRTKQMHACSVGRCLKLDKHGKMVCKRRAPFELSESDEVDDDGTYRVKRTLGYMNGYCPAIAVTAKCNNDIKMLLHGFGTNNITYYVTKYIAKQQGRSHNTSSLLAKHLVFPDIERTTDVNNLLDRQRMLLLRAVNVLNREQEVPAPLAVSLLMGWGVVYCSHHYSPIYWGAFISSLLTDYPELRRARQPSLATETPVPEASRAADEGGDNTPVGRNEETGMEDEVEIVLDFDHHGHLRSRSQVEDYMHRGEECEGYNVLEFLVGTYDQRIRRQQSNQTAALADEPVDVAEPQDREQELPSLQTGLQRGRPSHNRVHYRASHPCYETNARVMRPPNHNTLPNFIGPRFPRRGDPEQSEFYSASVLSLLKPWRSFSDLKLLNESWEQALEAFLNNPSTSPRTHDIVSSLDHYHVCKAASEDAREKDSHVTNNQVLDDEDTGLEANADGMYPSDELDQAGPRTLTSSHVTPEMIAQARAQATSARDLGYAREATEIGRTVGLFAASQSPITSTTARATQSDVQNLQVWQQLLQQSLQPLPDPDGNGGSDTNMDDIGDVSHIDATHTTSGDPFMGDVIPESTPSGNALAPAAVEELFPEQRRAYEIVAYHLSHSLHASATNTPPPPRLRMLLIGEGGTGKSKVIQTITAEFDRLGVSHLLVKAAFTGVAATLIGGKTTHEISCISVNGRPLGDKGKARLAKTWKDPQYLIIDECSMLSRRFFAQLSEHISIGRMAHNPEAASSPFGDLNVIVCGDPHQLPPVASGKRSALYYPNLPEDVGDEKKVFGRTIFEAFKTVVILRRQVRVSDPEWRNFLGALRVGRIEPRHISMLKELVLTNPICKPIDPRSEKWRNVSLVTPRHVVRIEWNETAALFHCQQTGNQLFICPANDTIQRRPLTMLEQYVAACSNRKGSSGKSDRDRLPDEVLLAVGMQIMFTQNIETDLGIANGSRGTIVGIMLDPDEPSFELASPVVTLKQLPSYILVKMSRSTGIAALPTLEPDVLPVIPVSKTFHIKMDVRVASGEVMRTTKVVRRLQFPITPAYAFTDYRSQGQTIDSVIVDITTPPDGGKLSLFNLYVALSRSSGRETIRILRDFDERLFAQPLDPDLLADDDRLERLDRETAVWWEDLKGALMLPQ